MRKSTFMKIGNSVTKMPATIAVLRTIGNCQGRGSSRPSKTYWSQKCAPPITAVAPSTNSTA